MNKIMKEINELKGDLNNSCSTEVRECLTINLDGEYYSFSPNYVDDNDMLICTTEEFNDLVSQLETNFGQSITRTEYMQTTFWDNAPDDCVGAVKHENNDYSYVWGHSVKEQSGKDCYSFCQDKNATPVIGKSHFEFIPRPEVVKKAEQPKRYWDGKEELQVGMWVDYHDKEREILLLADIDGDFITIGEEGSYNFDRQDCFKPIDTRTDKQKFVDEFSAEYVKDASTTFGQLLEKAYDKLKGE